MKDRILVELIARTLNDTSSSIFHKRTCPTCKNKVEIKSTIDSRYMKMIDLTCPYCKEKLMYPVKSFKPN